MAHLQYLPGDPRLVDQLVYELKSKGIFDQFRKDCIADVDTRPAYQNLRQRVENSVTTFLSRQCWQPDLNKNQLREKLRKHILDGNYLEQGVERIVDQVVNPKVASVFIPQVEDLVYNYLGITRKKAVNNTETSNGKVEDLLPTDLEAVSPGSVKSNEDKNEQMDVDITVDTKVDTEKMEVEEDKPKSEEKDKIVSASETNHADKEKIEVQESELSATSELTSHDSNSNEKNVIPLRNEDIKLENIPPPDNSPPKVVELEKIELPKEIICSVDIPLPGENTKEDKESYFKPINSDDDDSSSDSSLRRNMSPLTPIRNFNNENSCDAQQGFDNDSSDSKNDDKKEPNQTSSFRFAIEAQSEKTDNGSEAPKSDKKPNDQLNLAYQFNNQMTINNFNTPMYEDSSNSNHLQIDYESDANSKVNLEKKTVDAENSEDSKKEQKSDERKSSHKSSHRSRDSHKHSSSKDRRSESKHSSSRDSSRHDKKSKEDSRRSKSNQKESSKDKNDKKDSKESSRHSSHKSSSHKDSKSHRSSSSSQRHLSKSSDDKKSSSSHRDKTEKNSDKSSRDKLKDSKSSSRSDKDRKSSNKSKYDDKDKDKKEKKEQDDHYSLSGRGNPNRRSTDRDSNDGSSSSKGSHNPPNSKSSESKKDSKNSSSKSDNMSTSSESTSPSDRELTLQEKEKEVIDMLQPKPIVRLESHLETPIASPPHLPFVPDIKLKKPKFAANLEEAKKLIKMRKFLDEEQKRMNQEAALLLEFQANVRPSLSQIYSSIPGPELEFACVKHTVVHTSQMMTHNNDGVHENVYSSDQNNYAEDEGFSDHVEDDVPSTLTVREVEESIESINEELNNKAKAHAYEEILSKETYESTQAEDTFIKSERFASSVIHPNDEVINDNYEESDLNKNSTSDDDHKKSTEYFEVTIIAEEISENEETLPKTKEVKVTARNQNRKVNKTERVHPEQSDFHYFGEHEKYNAELERDRFSKFIKVFTEVPANKVYLINCDTYEEKIVQEVLESFGKFEIVNYQRNGHLKVPKNSKNVVKDLNLSSEVVLPLDKEAVSEIESKKPLTESVFSPVKSECSFELSSDYDAKLEEMVNKTSRQEIMEIILGNVIADSPTKMPRIDYFTDSNIESEGDNNMKRKHSEMETVNNNRQVLTPNKLRRLSTSDQISSTTEDLDEGSNKNITPNPMRSKYLGRARRVGLSRPRKTELPNSPSSDKSVENYEQNTPVTQQPPNGKMKTTPRNKVQRYDTSDLYKPKLHYLSRRNNIS